MLIRASGYNTGAQEYLEQGNKSGREFTRDELDHRMIIDGQLSVTRAIYESIPDHGQDRYLTFTMSFKEDTVSPEVLKSVTAEFKQFLMHAYKAEEFNFYAEAHLPKMKTIKDKKTGELIERKPHIHIIVPRINLLSGNEANPVDIYMNHEKYFEAFQEYINQNYNLSSPRESVRADITDAASVLSRYKGDDFYGKNRQFKQELVKQVIERGVTSRADFYALAAEYGETKIRNQGKDTEYLSVKLPGDAKGTNLKDTIFQDDFIVRRELKKPPLEPHVIQERLLAWPQRAREIKYVNKATPSFRKLYSQASPEERIGLLAEREDKFYKTYGEHHGTRSPTQKRDNQRSPVEADGERRLETTFSVPDMSGRDVADHGQTGQARGGDSSVLLQGDAHVHLGQSDQGGDPGLRPPVSGGRRGSGRSPGRPGRPQRHATVSASTNGKAKSRRGGAPSPGRGLGHGLTEYPFPPAALNPHRVPTLADIEARGRRLFDPLKEPASTSSQPATGGAPGTRQPSATTWSRKGKRSGATAGRNPKRLPVDTRPPYARNPHRVASVADIEARARRLFDPLKQPVEQSRVIKLPSIKSLLVNRQASTVAAYFTRQAEHNQLMPAQRHALRRVNKQFFDLRRSVFSDQRLTRQDKAQLVSVLTFERLKAREAIHNPQHHNEAILMGSAEIRKLMAVEEPEDLGFSISGPSGPDTDRAAPEGVRARTKQLLDNLSQRLDPKPQTASERERERELNAKDLYTRKSKFSQNVHYLDKTTNKTLFVDTGKAIAMRRTGITESGVAVALQLAKERFGSTLTINGTTDFKKLVIEAAAKSGMDIHFTDKSMNEGLTARRAELEIEREGQGIAQPSAVDLKVVQAAAPVTAASAPVVSPTVVRDPVVPTDAAKVPSTGPEPIQFTHNGQPAILDLSRYSQPGAVSPPEPATQSDVVTQGPSELAKMDTQWRESLGLSEHDIAGSESAMQVRGENHANWLFGTADHTPDALAMITQYMQNDSYRESFKIAIEDLYVLTENVPDARASLDAATGFVEDLVNRIETQEAPADASKPADRRVVQGELVAHGAAPYQHNEKLRDKPLSYFVTVKPDGGEPRTVWGVGLADVMAGDPAPFKEGDRIRLVDLGTQPVTVPETQPDGSTIEKLTHRRQWAGQMEGAVKEGPTTAPVAVIAAVATVTLPQAETDGPEMD